MHFRSLLVCAIALLLCACAARDVHRPPAPLGERSISAQPAAPPSREPVLPEGQPSAPVATPLAGAPPVASNTAAHIALILPLAAKSFGAVAEAFKQGFVAAATFDGRNAPAFRIYTADNEGDSLESTFRKAVGDGATLIIAGLTRDGATLLARLGAQQSAPPILALNTPDVGVPDRYYYVSLSLDYEARQTALFVATQGARSAAIIHSNSALAKRIQEGFEKEWIRLGGSIVARIVFDGDPGAAPRIRAKLDAADSVFIAAEPDTTRFARPYVPSGMPVYATSLSFDPYADALANIDLDGVRFLDMPWFVQPDHLAVVIYPRPAVGTAVEQERLYALGVDAWRLALLLQDPNRRSPILDGVTGRLTLDAGRQFLRTLTAVEFREGRAQLYKPLAE